MSVEGTMRKSTWPLCGQRDRYTCVWRSTRHWREWLTSRKGVRWHFTIFFCSRAFRSRKIPLTRSYWYTITANYYPSLIVFNSWKVFGRLFEIMGILYVQGVNMWVVCTRGRKGVICTRAVSSIEYVHGWNVTNMYKGWMSKYVQGSSVNQKKAVPGGKGRVWDANNCRLNKST